MFKVCKDSLMGLWFHHDLWSTLIKSRLCFVFGVLQVRLAGLLELSKTNVNVQVALTREHHQRQHFLALQQKVCDRP